MSNESHKPSKSAFVLKLSSETVQKLKDDSDSSKGKDVQELLITEECKISDASESTKQPEGFSKVEKSEQADTGPHTQQPQIKTQENNTSYATKCAESNDSSDPWNAYRPYIKYEGETAIYTDPATNIEYTWCDKTSSWIQKDPDEKPVENSGREYSYENDTHVYTEPDGTKFFWDTEKKAWIPKVDDEFLAMYQMSYGFVDNVSKEPEKEEVKPCKKSELPPQKRKAEPAQWFDASEDNNTKVYVSNLPLDLKEEEFVDLMQKCGLVMRDPQSQKMKVKLYMDKEHNCFKGDALCTYIKIESVDLALNLLDGYEYKGNKLTVQRAKFQLKGEYNPALKPKKKKKKELEKIKRMQEKLFDWRPEKALGERGKHEKIVIIKNLFEPSDFDKEVQLILDYQQDLREECNKCGEVKKVIIYDRHPEGVAQVNMKEPEQADAVIQLINGRWFGKRKITAEIWDGKTKYKIAETDADINKRVGKWEKFLEGEDAEGSANNEKSVEKPVSEKTDQGSVEKPSLSKEKEEIVAEAMKSSETESIDMKMQ